MLMLVSCPECGATAEITDRFRLPSTAGPVDHVTVNCVAGHHFRMPADDVTDARHRVTGYPTDRSASRRAAFYRQSG